MLQAGISIVDYIDRTGGSESPRARLIERAKLSQRDIAIGTTWAFNNGTCGVARPQIREECHEF
jgi:hypothetical protein